MACILLQHRSQRRSTTLFSSNLPSQLFMRQRISILNIHSRTTSIPSSQRMNVCSLTSIQNRLIPASIIQHHSESRWQITATITEQRVLHQATVGVLPKPVMMIQGSTRRMMTASDVVDPPLSLTSTRTLNRTGNARQLLEQATSTRRRVGRNRVP